MHLKKFKILIIIFLLINFYDGVNTSFAEQRCTAFIDASGFDFMPKNSFLELNQNWQVIPNVIMRPSLDEVAFEDGMSCTSIPDKWASKLVNGSKVGEADKLGVYNSAAFGFKTYRLKLKLPKLNDFLALKIPYQYSAYELWVDNELAAQNGLVGATADEEQTFSKLQVAKLPKKQEIMLTMIISNHSNSEGGFYTPISLGKYVDLNNSKTFYDFSYVFLVSILVCLFSIHSIYTLKGYGKYQTRSHSLISALVFLLLLRITITQQLVQIVFPETPQQEYLFFEYLTIYILPSLYIGFLATVFPKEFSSKINIFIYVCCLIGVVYVSLTPSFVYTKTRDFWMLFMVAVTFYGVICVSLAVKNKRIGAYGIAASGVIFFVGIVHDTLYHAHYIDSIDLAPFVIVIFAMAFSVALSQKQIIAYSELAVAKRKLGDVNFDLESQVLKRTNELQLALDDAEQSKLEKSRFLSAASHDMRQPVHALALQNYVLKSKVDACPDISDILNQQNALIGTITNLLSGMTELAKLNEGQIKAKISKFELCKLFDDVKIEVAPKALEFGVDVKFVGKNLAITSDWALLKRILVNLISNAIHSCKTQGQGVSKVLVGYRIKAGKPCIQVLDNGIGIPEDEQELIFKRFKQATNNLSTEKSKNIKNDNMGLGLSIVQQLTKLLNIRIVLSSTPNKGTDFNLIFENNLK